MPIIIIIIIDVLSIVHHFVLGHTIRFQAAFWWKASIVLTLADSKVQISVAYSKTDKTTQTHTHQFNNPLSRTTQVSWYQKGKTNLDFTEARNSRWQWHQLGHMQVCTSLQTDNHASTPPLNFSTGRMPFLPPNQQH